MSDVLIEVAHYYAAKLAEHGDTARGVDWNNEASQTLRFEQLSKVIAHSKGFSINDLGCGYGALFEYLNFRYQDFTYKGYDISEDMIRIGRVRHSDVLNAYFSVASEPHEAADYGIASGIFNVRLSNNETDWRDYLEVTLDALHHTSRCGFAFNCLTSYSDTERMRNYLYYADPCMLFDLCKRKYSRNVALLHDYGLFEFTILVRK